MNWFRVLKVTQKTVSNYIQRNNKIAQIQGLKVWLDDIRAMPAEFDIHVKTAPEAINILSQGNVTDISLDHDLGEPSAGTGYDVASWIEKHAFLGELPPINVTIHSANPIGRQRMFQAIQNAQKYWNRS